MQRQIRQTTAGAGYAAMQAQATARGLRPLEQGGAKSRIENRMAVVVRSSRQLQAVSFLLAETALGAVVDGV